MPHARPLTLGAVTLRTADLSRLRDFYYDVLGLDILESSASHATLGANKRPLVRLSEFPAPAAKLSEAGLYHLALLYPSAGDLARTLVRVLRLAPESFQGSSDHIVSQAYYFSDPDGNGIELYVDRPKAKWEWVKGRIKMGSRYLDPMAFIEQHPGKPGISGASMGHVHLKVGDLTPAKRFYVDGLGLDITAEVPGALFVSSGGYHHHLGLNTWESQGTGRRPKTCGLGSLEIILPNSAELKAVEQRLFGEGFSPRPHQGFLLVEDPWGTEVLLRTPAIPA
jgi:catechol 2,3-dioxygenase